MAKRKPKPTDPRDHSTLASVVFYNADMGLLSPAVRNFWPRPVQELIRESEALYSTNFPCAVCARFVGECLTGPDADGYYLGLYNVPVPNWAGEGAGPPPTWHDEMLAELRRWDPDAVLVRLDGLTVTQNGRLLWRADWVRRPTGQRFAPISGRRRTWINRQLTAARRFVSDDSPVVAAALDRAWAAWLSRLKASLPPAHADPTAMMAYARASAGEIHAILEAVGVQFGQLLVDEAGFEWATATDADGTELVVRALHGRGDVLVYPLRFVQQRWYQKESAFLAASLDALREDVAAVAKGQPAPHWPW